MHVLWPAGLADTACLATIFTSLLCVWREELVGERYHYHSANTNSKSVPVTLGVQQSP